MLIGADRQLYFWGRASASLEEIEDEDYAVNAVPIFVDKHATHCAVGYLMHRSAHDAAVAEVVNTNNLVYVKDATSGQLVDWIKFSGLSSLILTTRGNCLSLTTCLALATTVEEFLPPAISLIGRGLG